MTEDSKKIPSAPTPVSTDEARQALATVEAVEHRIRKSISLGGGAYFLILWGLIWIVGFVGSHFLAGRSSGLLWAGLNLVGLTVSVWLSFRLGRQVREPGGTRVGLFWLCLVVYSLLWLWLARPTGVHQVGVLAASFAMFGYVVMGLWLDRFFLWLGLAVTAVAVASFHLWPEAYGLWIAAFGGGSLLVSGLHIRRRWR